MSNLSFRNVSKVYEDGTRAVSNFNLEVKDHEFLVLVGPSGCGKTTLLRLVAGLEEINSGELYIDGVLVNDVPPQEREISMMFQNYALFPTLSVYENLAFGLKIKKIDPEEIDRRVKETAELLDISDLLTRKPKAISGGQRQRVALGRAIIREPKVFLLDEPLSNVDPLLRNDLKDEIVKLHKKLNATFIYVTHDQKEALSIADRIVVMKDGNIEQIDIPERIISNPSNEFVKDFFGNKESEISGLPVYQKIPASYKDGKIIIGKNKNNVPEDIKSHYFSIASKETTKVSIYTESISLSEVNNALKLKVSIESNVNGLAVATINDTNSKLSFRAKESLSGERYIHIPYKSIVLLNENNEKLSSKEEVKSNQAKCFVVNHGDKSIINVGRTKLVFDSLNVEPGEHIFELIPNKCLVQYERKYAKRHRIVQEKDKNVLPASAYGEDQYFDSNIIYVQLPGFEDYVSLIVPNKFSVHVMPKFGIKISKDSFILK